jgi:hypothetical protein
LFLNLYCAIQIQDTEILSGLGKEKRRYAQYAARLAPREISVKVTGAHSTAKAGSRNTQRRITSAALFFPRESTCLFRFLSSPMQGNQLVQPRAQRANLVGIDPESAECHLDVASANVIACEPNGSED